MAFVSKKNNAFSKVATVGGINDSDDPVTFSVTTSDGTKFPTTNFKLSVDDEIMLATSRTGDSITATRAQEGTAKASHSQNADIELRITSGTLGEYEDIFDKTKTTSNAEDILLSEQASTPTNPAAGYRKIYPKTDGILYALNSSGTETPLSNPIKATATEVATGTEDAKFTTPLAVAPYANSSMSRQAIMNGNFDVWQRGTSVALTDVTIAFLADRWRDYVDKNTGTLPTLTRSRQLLTSGDIANAFYYSRIAFNGAGTSLGADSFHWYSHRVEYGTRLLCGLNKELTLSFWARSDVTNKKLGFNFGQYYGSGGSPTAEEDVNGTYFSLTTSWTKYTYTFTTNTLVGKTFGTDNNDSLFLKLWPMWGTNGKTKVAAAAAETYVGAGYIDIAQVQLCAGDVALPFQPKSYNQELLDCMRYYEQSVPGQYGGIIFSGNVTSGQSYFSNILYKTRKRITTTPVFTNIAVSNFNSSVGAVSGPTDDGVSESRVASGTGAGFFASSYTVDAEL